MNKTLGRLALLLAVLLALSACGLDGDPAPSVDGSGESSTAAPVDPPSSQSQSQPQSQSQSQPEEPEGELGSGDSVEADPTAPSSPSAPPSSSSSSGADPVPPPAAPPPAPPQGSSNNTTRSYFSGYTTGNASENQQALQAALDLIDSQGWDSYSGSEYQLVEEIAAYVASSISYGGSGRNWTAYAGLVDQTGTCWAYANAYLFIAKELGLPVKVLAVRDGTLPDGIIDIKDYHTDADLGMVMVASDHMAIEYNYGGTKILVETQGGDLFIMEDSTWYYLDSPP